LRRAEVFHVRNWWESVPVSGMRVEGAAVDDRGDQAGDREYGSPLTEREIAANPMLARAGY
jgi:hypothetical protein